VPEEDIMRSCNNFLDEMYKTFPGMRHGEAFINDLMKEFSYAAGGMSEVVDNGDYYTIEIELPGVEKNKIDLSFKDDEITVSWQPRSRTPDNQEATPPASRSRAFPVKGGDADKISAELVNGILIVTVPKLPEKKARNINIK
jgi:HSP20 family protein